MSFDFPTHNGHCSEHHHHHESMLFHDDHEPAVFPSESDFQDFAPWNADCGLSHFPTLAGMDSIMRSHSPAPLKPTFAFNDWAHVAPLNTSSSTTASSLSSYDGNHSSDPYHTSFLSPPLSSMYSSSPELNHIDSIAQSIETDNTEDHFGHLGLSSFTPSTRYVTPHDLGAVSDNVNSTYFDYNPSPPPLYRDERHTSMSSDFDLSSEFATPMRQRGRPRHHSRSVSTMSVNKVMKRPTSANIRRLSAPIRSLSVSTNGSPARQMRATPSNSNFPCPFAAYGCTSSFGSKNEWKRHVSTQHLRLDLWRCDQCGDRDTRPNDFNRKDLFIQHLRRMHFKNPNAEKGANGRARARSSSLGDEIDPALIAAEQRCHIKLRQPPNHSCCLFCPQEFEGPGSWDERMEHVGRHLEHIKKQGRDAPALSEWNHDEAFHNWLANEGLIALIDGEWQMADGRRYTR
ncbi:hypothetical protein K461DRAFT_314217 [Myriangium duriaei CBS 260.36]|uniref:C2H2-type domain-containing protein n=1 Tax=Myriangium duriaei CBS 260.36 TaxID=1168546 RepID=A0A9P4IWS5_9PEZI|nr:hypothetical protein K461DRAFT_314217 [Myriangium duriaei CBS 260.36]